MSEKAIIYPDAKGTPTIEVEVTEADLDRGTVRFECPSCKGTGEIDWHPDGELHDCIECSTRGYREAPI